MAEKQRKSLAANVLLQPGIHLSDAISAEQDDQYFRRDGGAVLVLHCCGRLRGFGAQRFCSEFLTYADSNCLADTGLYPDSKPDSHSDPAVPDENHSQSDSDSDPNPNPKANAHTSVVSRSECNSHADTPARTRGVSSWHKNKTRRFSPAGSANYYLPIVANC